MYIETEIILCKCGVKDNEKELITTLVDDSDSEFRRSELLRVIREIYEKGTDKKFISGKDRMRYIQLIEALCN